MTRKITAGSPSPPGVTPAGDGVNVAVFSAHATRMDFCLFDAGDVEIDRIALPARTGDIHHAHISGVPVGSRYGLRAHGPFEPQAGHRFNPNKLLLDPYAEVLDRRFELHESQFGHIPTQGPATFSDTDSAPFTPKAMVTPPAPPAEPPGLRVPWRDTVIYELNVRGFTMRCADVPEALRGTFAGLAHPAAIAHFRKLGVTTLELMPAMAWIDERHLGPLGLVNAWGYNPVGFAAPDPKLAPGGWGEIRKAVDALHAAGLEVILDVVLNHSGEGDALGPTLSMRGLDNASYYRLRPDDPAGYIDDMGCGNCLALDREPAMGVALHALRTWVRRGGLDGFRFDLATAMGRRPEGFDPHAPLIEAIRRDPELSGLKLIAEAWDIGPGGYQVGRFPGDWGEWNDRYRDTARRFWRGDHHMIGDLATRLAGSADLFAGKEGPARGVNFITAHDGFTLADVVSYEGKHNEANGEHNRDGTSANHSWNHGVEGPTDDARILDHRRRDQINLMATLLFSRGAPMLFMGSEFGHSQRGNNNAYAQDNQTAWLDWGNADPLLLEAARGLIAARRDIPLLRDDRFLSGGPVTPEDMADASWLRPDGAPMQEAEWNAGDAGVLVLQLAGNPEGGPTARLLLVLNRRGEAIEITLPEPREGLGWRRRVDTAADPAGWASANTMTGRAMAAARSISLFVETGEQHKRQPGPPADDTIHRLAAATGIYSDWWDHSGVNHPVSVASKRAMLAGMGLDVSGDGAARDALAALAGTRQRRALPQSLAAREGEAVHIACGLTHAGDAQPRWLIATDETGREQRLPLAGENARREDIAGIDGRVSQRWMAALPPLPAGRYALRRDDAPDAPCLLTIGPRAGYRPARLKPGFGISAQLYTLRRTGDQGIGDFTTLARMGEASAEAGALAFGVNPLHALFPGDRERASPYHPSDRRFIDPIYIDIDALGWLAAAPDSGAAMAGIERLSSALRQSGDVDYAGVSRLKSAVLHARFASLMKAGEPEAFRAFVAGGGVALRRFATFRAIEEKHPGLPWQKWPGGLCDADSPAVTAFAAGHAAEIAFECFQQWVADRQLGEAARRATGLPLGFYRDLAVGCAPDGAEAWASEGGLVSGMSVGAPPDPFSASGQVWCLPPPNPLAMAANGCAAFRELIAANMRHAGMLRIDHVMGLTRLFWVPDGAKATEGAYVSYDRDAQLAELALESQRNRCLVVGEDLGTVPDGFREALQASGVLSYRVLWFERQGAGFLAPEHYPADAVACVSTHDLATLAGWWSAADIAELQALDLATPEATLNARAARDAEKRTLAQQLAEAGFLAVQPDFGEPLGDDFAAAVHAFIAATPSLIAFAQADDLAGEASAVNLPGTDRERPNWRRKLETPIEGLLASARAKAILAALAKRKATAP